MARESFDCILNIEHRPNNTGILLAIPMYMYRIETFSIKYGINFFQKAVLMFKTKPWISNVTIANHLGLDINLIDTVAKELVNMRLIGKDGLLTEDGQKMKNDIDGFFVDEKQKSIGYVFQYINNEDLYSFYVNKINKASVSNNDICIGTKGNSDDEDFYVSPIRAEKLLEKRQTNPAPSERDIIDLIRRSNKHAYTNKDVDTLNIDEKKYGIKYVPNNQPTIVWICTYAYVPRIDNNIYESDWKILDPFGFDNNSELKFYVNSLISDGLIDDFTSNFKDLRTVDNLTYDQFQKKLEEWVNEEMDKIFEIDYLKLDQNLITYLKSVVRSHILLDKKIEINNSNSFVNYIQQAIETIFKLDSEKYKQVYDSVKKGFNNKTQCDKKYSNFSTPESRQAYIDELLKNGGLKADSQTINSIKILSKTFDYRKSYSLKYFLIGFLFTHKDNPNNPLYDIIKEKVGIIYEIANNRNVASHGQTSKEGRIYPLEKDKIEQYFDFFKHFINNYIVKYNE